MRHHQHRHAFLCELLHDGQHLSHQLGVERRGRLIEEHDLRLHREGAGDGHTLLLSAGELGRIGIRLVTEADFFQKRLCHRLHLFLRELLDLHRGEHDILQHRQMREQMESLENHSHLDQMLRAFLCRHFDLIDAVLAIVQQDAIDPYFSVRHLLEMIQRTQEG